MGARQYSPLLGRFLEVDPVEGGSANDYEYCSGDPVGCLDLDGRDAWMIRWAVDDRWGNRVVMRAGRHRKKASKWTDGFGNFGAAHAGRNSKIGLGKDWISTTTMHFDVRQAIERGARYPDAHDSWNVHYVYCRELRIGLLTIRTTTTVVVDTRPAYDGAMVGVKTAWQNTEYLGGFAF